MDFPLGEVVRGVELDKEPVVVFMFPDGGVSAAAYRDGAWGPADLAAVVEDGHPMPLSEIEAWVDSMS